MKTTIKIAIIIVFSIISINSFAQRLIGNGKLIKQNREIPEFTAITVNDGIDVFIRQGNTVSLQVETDENLQESIITEVNNGVLKMYIKDNIQNARKINVYLTVTNLSSISANEGCDITTETELNVKSLEINCNEGSDLKLDIIAEELSCILKEGSDAKIKGEAERFNLNAKEGSDIYAQ